MPLEDSDGLEGQWKQMVMAKNGVCRPGKEIQLIQVPNAKSSDFVERLLLWKKKRFLGKCKMQMGYKRSNLVLTECLDQGQVTQFHNSFVVLGNSKLRLAASYPRWEAWWCGAELLEEVSWRWRKVSFRGCLCFLVKFIFFKLKALGMEHERQILSWIYLSNLITRLLRSFPSWFWKIKAPPLV